MSVCKSYLFSKEFCVRVRFCLAKVGLGQNVNWCSYKKVAFFSSFSSSIPRRAAVKSTCFKPWHCTATRTMGGQTSKEEMVEAYACKVDEMKDGEMREIVVGDGKALLVRDQGEYNAIGHKCTHYGAPLVKGALKNGHVRCPWHGACFNVRTGDIEDYPGLDCVPKHEVVIQDGDKVVIRAAKSALGSHKRYKTMVQTQNVNGAHVLIVGGGPASVTCAEVLRQKSFTGRITIATQETHLPYDRTKLSKAMDVNPENIYLRPQDFYDAVNIKILTQKRATEVNAEEQYVTFEDGEQIQFDKLVIATGGRPRTLPIPGWDLKNVFVLRTPDDANAIIKVAKDRNVVVCGASFIGMEVASSLVSKAKKVSVCEFFSVPFERVLGRDVGLYLQKLHETKGVNFFMNASMVELQGDGVVQRAVLKDGSILEADLVIAGVGVIPSTEFLKDTGMSLTSHGFVNVDKHLRIVKAGTEGEVFENIFAAGDIAMFPQKLRDWQPSNIQHWQMAHFHGRCVATNIVVNPEEMCPVNSVPFFWTQQYGKSLRYTGYGVGYDDIVVTGDVSAGKFCAYYTCGEKVIAVATMMSDPVAANIAQRMLDGEVITKSDVKK
uniref:Apoptosis-inducing factor 3-like n=1 Tax=Phallusia mammillata TaxID=59560 RepID=A0A6F9D6A9_9ASCI|nr:apoptosis-inducing factor 3-like [Phallusia mammillata]